MSQQPNQDCTTVRFLSETFVLETMTDHEFDILWGRAIDYGSDLVEEQANGPAAIGRDTPRVLLPQLIEQNLWLLNILGREADRRKRLALEAARQQAQQQAVEAAADDSLDVTWWIISWLGIDDTDDITTAKTSPKQEEEGDDCDA